MKQEWKTFLENAGAEFEGETVVSFGNPDLERRVVTRGMVICDLSHQGLIVVHGADAQDFLHAQCSNNMGALNEQRSQLGAYCSPKGRMFFNFRVFKRGDSFYLRLPREMVEQASTRLQRFVLRSRLTLEQAQDTFVRMGLCGPQAEAELRNALRGAAPPQGAVPPQGIASPQGIDEVFQDDEVAVIRIPGPHPRFEIYGNLHVMKKLWMALEVRCARVGAGPWALLEILAGIPTVYPQTADAFVPQMANMQLLGGVSFTKGCYPGQEVIARMRYLGKLKRRMYRAHVATDVAPQPGDALESPEAEEDVGTIVDAQPGPDGGYEVLAVIQIAKAASGKVRLHGADGAPLKLLPLPYPFDEDETRLP